MSKKKAELGIILFIWRIITVYIKRTLFNWLGADEEDDRSKKLELANTLKERQRERKKNIPTTKRLLVLPPVSKFEEKHLRKNSKWVLTHTHTHTHIHTKKIK